MIKAYVLVQTEVGCSGEIATLLRAMDEVKLADEVTGPYDVVAMVEAPDVHALGGLLTRQIQKVKGVARTVTCTVHSP